MGGGGFMHDANKRIQQNRNKLNRSSLFDRDKLKQPGKSKTHLKERKISSEKMNEALYKIALKKKLENQTSIIKLIVSLVIIITITLIIFL